MTGTWRFITTDVFTTRRFGGNPLCVVPDAAGLSTHQMQSIAREFNYSESVFVLPAEHPDHLCRLRIFTPAAEIPFAGHPTVGAAITLAELERIDLGNGEASVILGEGVGPVRVVVRRENDGALFGELTAAMAPANLEACATRGEIAEALSLSASDFDEQRPPGLVTCGLPFTFATVTSREVLQRIRVREGAFAGRLGTDSTGIFVLSHDPEEPTHHVRARMFAPLFGVVEDPATGSACAALGGYLAPRLDDGTHDLIIEQGYEMGRPSQIHLSVAVRDGRALEARVGGYAVRFAEGTLRV